MPSNRDRCAAVPLADQRRIGGSLPPSAASSCWAGETTSLPAAGADPFSKPQICWMYIRCPASCRHLWLPRHQDGGADGLVLIVHGAGDRFLSAVLHRFCSHSTQPRLGKRRHAEATVARPSGLECRRRPIRRGDPEIDRAPIQDRLGPLAVELEGCAPLKEGHCLGHVIASEYRPPALSDPGKLAELSERRGTSRSSWHHLFATTLLDPILPEFKG